VFPLLLAVILRLPSRTLLFATSFSAVEESLLFRSAGILPAPHLKMLRLSLQRHFGHVPGNIRHVFIRSVRKHDRRHPSFRHAQDVRGIARPASAVLHDLRAVHRADEPSETVRSWVRKYAGR